MQAVDELLWKWDAAYGKLQAAEAAFEASGCKRRPTHHLKKLRCRGLAPTDPCHMRSRGYEHFQKRWLCRESVLESLIKVQHDSCPVGFKDDAL